MKRLTRFGMWQIKTIQYGALFAAIFFAPVADWSLMTGLIAFLMAHVYGSIGISMMYHRYYSHRSFEFRWAWLEYPLAMLGAFAGRGSPMAWAHIHRTHHKCADKEGDPHKPGDSLKVFSFDTTKIHKFVPLRVVDLLGRKFQRALHDYYLLIILGWLLILGMIGGFNALYFGWIVPAVLYQLFQDIWNYYGHKATGWSYQNWGGECSTRTRYEYVENYSQNNSLLYPMVLGEAWHNNHHQFPGNYRMSYRDYEADPVAWLIERIKT